MAERLGGLLAGGGSGVWRAALGGSRQPVEAAGSAARRALPAASRRSHDQRRPCYVASGGGAARRCSLGSASEGSDAARHQGQNSRMRRRTAASKRIASRRLAHWNFGAQEPDGKRCSVDPHCVAGRYRMLAMLRHVRHALHGDRNCAITCCAYCANMVGMTLRSREVCC